MSHIANGFKNIDVTFESAFSTKDEFNQLMTTLNFTMAEANVLRNMTIHWVRAVIMYILLMPFLY